MSARTATSAISDLELVAARQPGLTLLVLFGSRARGDASAASDWDFGYLSDGSADPAAISTALGRVVGSERVDLVDLARANGLLRYRVARDGVLVFEAPSGSFDRFRFAAARFWFDAEPVLRPGYDAILERLG